MAIEVNNNHMNLATLAGLADGYLRTHELETSLYVYGTHGNRDYDFYIDADMPLCKEVCTFLATNGINCRLGLPTAPNKSPAVGISRNMRADHIDLATRVCVFIVLAINYEVEFPNLPPVLENIEETRPDVFNLALALVIKGEDNDAIVNALIQAGGNENEIRIRLTGEDVNIGDLLAHVQPAPVAWEEDDDF